MITFTTTFSVELEEDIRCCPLCGSSLFLSSRSISRSVFQVSNTSPLEVKVIRDNFQERESVDVDHIFCGACSWSGSITDLDIAL